MLESDEHYARFLAGIANETDSLLPITAALPESEDLKFARELQAKFDSEATSVRQELSLATERELLFQYGSLLLTLRCFSCKCPLMPNMATVDELNSMWVGRKHASSVLTCAACRSWTCCGCGGPPKGVHRHPVDGWSVTFCCDQGRLFLLWSLLCSVKHKPTSRPVSAPAMAVATNQRGKTGHRKSGVGYGDDHHIRHRKARDKPIDIKNVDPADAPTRRLLATLAALLPSWKNGSNFDNNAPQVLECMLRHSAIMENVAELLRNDSVDEIAKRGALYSSLFEFLDVLSKHPATARVLYDERAPRSDAYDLITLSFHSHMAHRSTTADKNQSLAKIMQNLRVQADTYLKQYRIHWGDSFEDKQSELTFKLCTAIVELASFIEANDSTKAGKEAEARSDEQDNREWHREHCVEDVPEDHILNNYYYAGKHEKVISVPRGRMKKLMLEMAALRTSLPEGIYVRHSSNRLDVMKVLIIGPAGTPYENGLFEFDLFCPNNYPNEPPKMQFKTTGKGMAHFNPNLYANGKGTRSMVWVC
jgi:baculoviral IAP repeat-containing protein 6